MTMADAKGKRRRVKQMEGLLLVARQEVPPRWTKPRVVRVRLQPQQLQLVYAAQEDREMKEILGRVDLYGASLEPVADGLYVHEDGRSKSVKLADPDTATLDAWVFALHETIAEADHAKAAVVVLPSDETRVQAAVTGSLRDEATDQTEFELTCQLVVPSRALDLPSIQWKAWKTADDLQLFDEQLRVSHAVAPKLRGIALPKERKRDTLFGGLRKKTHLEARQQQVAVYIDHLFSLNELSTDAWTADIVKRFLHFDWFFEIVERDSEQSDQAPSSLFESKSAQRQRSRSRKSSSSRSIGSDATEERSRPLSRRSSSGRSLDFDAGEERPRPRSRKSSSHRSDDTNLVDETTNIPSLISTGAVLREPEYNRHSPPTSGSSTDGSTFTDIEPEHDASAARKLHKQIIQIVRDIVSGDEGRVREFQDETKDFGQGRCSAQEYCAFLVGELGTHNFIELIPMMARLLTIDEKRHELLHAHESILQRKKRRERKRPKQYSESYVAQRTEGMHPAWELIAPRARPKSESFLITAASHKVELNEDSNSTQPALMQPRSWTPSTSLDPDFGIPSNENETRQVDTRSTLSPVGESRRSQTPKERIGSSTRFEEKSREPRRSQTSKERIGSWSSSGLDSRSSQVGRPQTSKNRLGSWSSSGFEEKEMEIEDQDDGPPFPISRQHPPEVSAVDSKSLPPVFRRADINDNGWINRSRSSQGSFGHRADRESYGQRSQKDRDISLDEPSNQLDNPEDEQPVSENPVLERLRRQGAVNFMLR